MTETLFAFDERNYRDCQSGFRGEKKQEYYLGDYWIETGSVIDVRADRKAVGACSIICLTSRTRLFFRRTWSHIREDGTDVTVLWFVRRGRLCVSHQSGHTIARAGDFVVTKSSTPFFIECQPGETGPDEDPVHEVLHVVVPSHVLRSYIPRDVTTGFAVPAGAREFVVAQHILTDLFEDEGALSGPVAQLLVDSALSVLAHAIRQRDTGAPQRLSVSDRRLEDVLRFIENHLSDPALSIVRVARGCGISPRYLSFLLKRHGTPFSTLVWEERLRLSARWLASSKPGEVSVSEIAYKVGFKSSAHFSRMFKRAYGTSPRAWRQGGDGAADGASKALAEAMPGGRRRDRCGTNALQ
jgi:AraC-like DNA-binding protein